MSFIFLKFRLWRARNLWALIGDLIKWEQNFSFLLHLKSIFPNYQKFVRGDPEKLPIDTQIIDGIHCGIQKL